MQPVPRKDSDYVERSWKKRSKKTKESEDIDMILSSKSTAFLDSQAGITAKQTLIEMDQSDEYKTDSSYSSNLADYPDSQIPFVDKHIYYLSTHMTVNPDHYIANLRLMTRLR